MTQPMDTIGIGIAGRRARQFALFDKGFRPFFLLSSLFAVVIVPLWIGVFVGGLAAGAHLTPIDAHSHEMVFGFATGVIAGFLLTAASNWTKRETATGGWLIALALLWLAGRIALLASSVLPSSFVAAVNLLFLPALAIALGGALLPARNRRNYGFLVLLAGLWLAQLVVHLGALNLAPIAPRTGAIVGVDLVLLIILLVGGRVIPLFTRNATQKADIQSVRFLDWAALAGMGILTALDVFAVEGIGRTVITGLTAALTLARAMPWGARHSLREPLLWVLHLGYMFVPLGLLLRSAASVGFVNASASLHLLTTGAIGTLTLGMMARVSLGHTGRPLRAGLWLGVAFAGVALAALTRVIGGALGGLWYLPCLYVSAGLWTLAFSIYLIRMTGALVLSRPDGRAG